MTAEGLLCRFYLDGNKRTAWVVARLFLMDNGLRLSFDPHDAIVAAENAASGKLAEAAIRLFFVMRLLDEAGLDAIIAEPVSETGLGVAIMDRLRRAAVNF